MRKPRKYRNTPTEKDGHRFDSKREMERYCHLKLLQMGGEIEALELQPKFPITVKGVKVCEYWGDFRYVERQTGETIVEDVKGVRTAVYKLKKKLVKACHGIDVVEV
jgi:hypothetical protein